MSDIILTHQDIGKLVKEGEQIIKAKQLLKNNGYVVKKWTEAMNRDVDECVEMDARGEQKDCCGCNCSVCLMQ